MFGKKAMIFTRARDTVSFFVGLILAAYGLIPILFAMKIIKFNLPGFLLNLPVTVMVWVVAAVGLYVLIDGVIEPPMHIFHWLLIIGGVIFMVIGLIPILYSFKVVPFTLPIKDIIVFQGIVAAEGLMLAIAGLTMH